MTLAEVPAAPVVVPPIATQPEQVYPESITRLPAISVIPDKKSAVPPLPLLVMYAEAFVAFAESTSSAYPLVVESEWT